jgi:hypothetical protein
MHTVPIEGKPCRVTLLELLILKTKAMDASGQPGAARLINWLRSQTELCEADLVQGAFAIVPETMPVEEFLAKEEMRTAHTLEPGTFVDVRAEEFLKAARGEPSRLGEALLAFHKKYGSGLRCRSAD